MGNPSVTGNMEEDKNTIVNQKILRNGRPYQILRMKSILKTGKNACIFVLHIISIAFKAT